MNWAAVFWLALMVVFLIAEAATVTMISLWFAAGALAAVLASLLHWATWIQVALFFLVSALTLLALRPMASKHFTPKITPTNVDAVVGSAGLVTAPIDNVSAAGQVKLGAMTWTARSTSGEPIPAGTLVRVDRIEGVRAFVSPAEEKETVSA